MKIWVYAICRNEKPIIGYFLRHYSTFADKIIIYDGYSDDGTRDIISACPKAELRDWCGSNSLADDEFHVFANTQWHEARGQADWVFWCDCDEILYHPKIQQVLAQYLADGIEVPRIAGFTMCSDTFPTTEGQIYEEVRNGFPDPIWSKPAIFQPKIDMMYTMGRHGIEHNACNPTRSAVTQIKLLHFRCLGLEYLRQRHARNWARVPERCREMNLGTNTSPGYLQNHGVLWFEEAMRGHLMEVI